MLQKKSILIWMHRRLPQIVEKKKKNNTRQDACMQIINRLIEKKENMDTCMQL
jgi:hypothetical protein